MSFRAISMSPIWFFLTVLNVPSNGMLGVPSPTTSSYQWGHQGFNQGFINQQGAQQGSYIGGEHPQIPYVNRDGLLFIPCYYIQHGWPVARVVPSVQYNIDGGSTRARQAALQNGVPVHHQSAFQDSHTRKMKNRERPGRQRGKPHPRSDESRRIVFKPEERDTVANHESPSQRRTKSAWHPTSGLRYSKTGARQTSNSAQTRFGRRANPVPQNAEGRVEHITKNLEGFRYYNIDDSSDFSSSSVGSSSQTSIPTGTPSRISNGVFGSPISGLYLNGREPNGSLESVSSALSSTSGGAVSSGRSSGRADSSGTSGMGRAPHSPSVQTPQMGSLADSTRTPQNVDFTSGTSWANVADAEKGEGDHIDIMPRGRAEGDCKDTSDAANETIQDCLDPLLGELQAPDAETPELPVSDKSNLKSKEKVLSSTGTDVQPGVARHPLIFRKGTYHSSSSAATPAVPVEKRKQKSGVDGALQRLKHAMKNDRMVSLEQVLQTGSGGEVTIKDLISNWDADSSDSSSSDY